MLMTEHEISYMQTHCKTQAKDFTEDEKKRRTRDGLVLIYNHLTTLGYLGSAEKLAQEAGIGPDRFELCDNISFQRMFVDFEKAYEKQYGVKPKIAKPVPKGKKTTPTSLGNIYDLPQVIEKAKNNAGIDGHPPKVKKSSKQSDSKSDNKSEKGKNDQQNTDDILSINATPIVAQPPKPKNSKKDVITDETPLPVPPDVQLMKPVPPQLRADFGDLTDVIARDIFTANTGVTWSDIVGLNGAKRVLREAVVMPLKFPQLFEGKKLLRPWKGVLLHGPPGTGKTLLAKAVAGEGTTFFNISASTVISKWRGDSEKLIRVLFELARYHAPSTIFIDEMDSIMSKRSSEGEHEASRRMKTEMLTQMDGLANSNALVFVLAASNFPFDLDPALLRRLEKRILVPLPDEEARENLFRTMLTDDVADQAIDFAAFAKRTENYSGSDIRLVCKEAAMEPLRRLMASLQDKYGDAYLDVATDADIVLDLVNEQDLNLALSRTKPSLMFNMKKYQEWQDSFGVE